ncbi:Kappa-type opioid receptor [Holothuria leucospilota]|uniref:Kappa-type opioid receptor n=1 Tax=Holothuria leucospilota TaxID=206669 RepID=A0A9Q1C3U5_HOLLE|nr:Kappa-type opioid receptor [Holothuria leucospilota]
MSIAKTVTVFYIVMMIGIGVPGNVAVLLVFKKKPAEGAPKVLIRYLAVFDMLFCLVTPIGIISWIPNALTDVTCKIIVIATLFGDFLSLFLNFLLAVDRYIAVCQSKKYLLKPKHIKRAICFALIMSTNLASLTLFFFGAEKLHNNVICAVRRDKSKWLYLLVMVSEFILFLASCVIVGLLHFGMIKTVRNRNKIWRDRRNDQLGAVNSNYSYNGVERNLPDGQCNLLKSHPKKCFTEVPHECKSTAIPLSPHIPSTSRGLDSGNQSSRIFYISSDDLEDVHIKTPCITNKEPGLWIRPPRCTAGNELRSCNGRIIAKLDTRDGDPDDGSCSYLRHTREQRQQLPGHTKAKSSRTGLTRNRLTIMLSVTTLVFVLCWTPAFIVIFLSVSSDLSNKVKTPLGEFLYRFLRKSTTWSHAMNPIVYFLVNPQFRRNLRMRLNLLFEGIRLGQRSRTISAFT